MTKNNKDNFKPKENKSKNKPAPKVAVRPTVKKNVSIAQIKALQAKKEEEARKYEEAKKLAAEQQEEKLKLREEAIKQEKVVVEERKVEDKKQKILANLPVKKAAKPLVEEIKILQVNTDFKSPICCVLGHVDTGKTKLLDKLRETNVQGSEAGGITQQIGATFFPIQDLTAKCGLDVKDLPGILIIDTPGHESFSNLRSRGSSLCNLAILVVDIVHGLEPQTIESIKLLKDRRTPFIVALNKLDRIYGWKNDNFGSFEENYKNQDSDTLENFRKSLDITIAGFAQVGYNAVLFNNNPNHKKYISLVPTSAITGEGIPDLIRLFLRLSVDYMKERFRITKETVCTVLEVKHVEGYGITLDAILSNGSLKLGDKIAISGFEGPIFTTVKALLVPEPLKEIRAKSQYMQVKEVTASCGIKIVALNLENAISGSRLFKVDNNEEEIENALKDDISNVFSSVDFVDNGVYAIASTLGSLEALLSFLKKENIPISEAGLKIRRRELIKYSSKTTDQIILSFDYKVDKELKKEFSKVKVFEAPIIYHLVDSYIRYTEELLEKNRKACQMETVWPCELKILPKYVFCMRSPLVFGVKVLKGTLKLKTPLCVFHDKVQKIGYVSSIELNKNNVEKAKKDEDVCIKVELLDNMTPRVYGKNFDSNDLIYSYITKSNIEVLKKYYKEELSQEEVALLVLLKNKLNII